MTSSAAIASANLAAQCPSDLPYREGKGSLPPRQLVVLDFDGVLINGDSSKYLIGKLAPGSLQCSRSYGKNKIFVDLVSQALENIHRLGITAEEIKSTLESIYSRVSEATVQALSNLSQRDDITLLLLSTHSNKVFIKVILKKVKLDKAFKKVITNTAYWDGSGMLKVRPGIGSDSSKQRFCLTCEHGMCKGIILENLICLEYETSGVAYNRVVYVADDPEDLCPVLQLGRVDKVFCRTGYGLDRLISRHGDTIKPRVERWKEAKDLNGLLSTL